MSILCPNCKAKLGCSCQKRKASDGTQVCSNCLKNYETGLVTKNSNSPSNVTVFYNKPGIK